MRRTAILCEKKRRSAFALLRHRIMHKMWRQVQFMAPEIRDTQPTNQDFWLSRMDFTEGYAWGGRVAATEADQFNSEYIAARNEVSTRLPSYSSLELMEMNPQLPPGVLPFFMTQTQRVYDPDTKTYRGYVCPTHWKNFPGDDGLRAHRPTVFTGEYVSEYIEPTLENLTNGTDSNARFQPASPQEAAEIEAEDKHLRELHESMTTAVADLSIVEVPPYYISGQKNWMNRAPWWKAKEAKGTLTEQEAKAQSWSELVAWKEQ